MIVRNINRHQEQWLLHLRQTSHSSDNSQVISQSRIGVRLKRVLADYPKPVFLALVSPDHRKGLDNLVNPFLRITDVTRHLPSSRGHTQSTEQPPQCVSNIFCSPMWHDQCNCAQYNSSISNDTEMKVLTKSECCFCLISVAKVISTRRFPTNKSRTSQSARRNQTKDSHCSECADSRASDRDRQNLSSRQNLPSGHGAK